MIVISVVRFRKVWVPWLMRFLFILTLIYALTAAYQWFESASYSTTPQPVLPTLFADAVEGSPHPKANMPTSDEVTMQGYGT